MTANSDSGDMGGALLALSNDLAGAVERAGRSVVAIHARRRIPSSGIHWRQGVIVTADHTLKRDEDIPVTLAGGATVRASLAGRDSSTDIAVLRAEKIPAPAAELGDTGALKVGHPVLAVGRPSDGDVTASFGIVSATGGEWRTWHGGRIDRFVRVDLTIYDGFSGGPLVDAAGRVVGLNTSALARAIAVAIPVSTVNRVVDQLLEKGHVSRGYLGVSMQTIRVQDAMRKKLELPSDLALMVVGVEAGGPADRSGVLIGDVIVALDDSPVRDPSDVLAHLSAERVGGTVAAQIVRAGQSMSLHVQVGERPRGGR